MLPLMLLASSTACVGTVPVALDKQEQRSSPGVKVNAVHPSALPHAVQQVAIGTELKTDDGAGIDDPFGWIRAIESGPTGQKIQLKASTVYEIDRQYQLPRGTELVGAGTNPASRTVIRAVGKTYSHNCGPNATNRKGLVLGDDTVVRGLHLVGMETRRQPCLCAMIETPGCASGENTGCDSRPKGNHTVSPDCYYSSPPTETQCGGVIGKTGGNGVRNATVEDITVEAATTTTMFFMNPNIAGLRPSSDITVRNGRSSQTHADGISTSLLLAVSCRNIYSELKLTALRTRSSSAVSRVSCLAVAA